MRVLLTGAAGFIGGAVRDALHAAGHEVVAVDLMLPQAHGAAAAPAGVHRLDVRAADAWTELLGGIDVVCHQAAVVGAGTTVADLPLYASHNDLGTAALLAAMHAAGVDRLVLASSMVVYGEGRYACADHGRQRPGPRPVEALRRGEFDPTCPACGRALTWELVPEDAPMDPRSSYAASKVAQENYAAAWARQAPGAVVSLRYHNVYGPGMPRDTPYAGVAAIFRSALARGEAPRVFEDGGQVRDFVRVDDVAAANLAAVEAVATAAPGWCDAFNVCSGHPVTIAEVARLLAGDRGPRPEVTGEFRAGDVRHVVASPERAARVLGFTARTAPAVGIPAFATAPLRA
ncbi:NAD-dependent epimerase/dehydratase family protein [Nocardioides sp. GY 10113]|uniref:NAD-dependent epimerase/dehydratase family protein n=1 Tax=Nocardioides sp. GY 10113 TaxID=2569761 RepID=UPI0010A784B6|nr:NAD-dependent epimerase/dehydratase family protein [Nocardioides sp. GY 10113]TIC80652.1 NAD-dependent epimerase/dehydratase family protein [Nocardioides sp. GY 10113]